MAAATTTATTYKLVQCVEGQFIVTNLTEENLLPAMEVRGYEFEGFETNKRLRPELQGQPKFRGVLGPMWDGGPIRYECPKAYAIISA